MTVAAMAVSFGTTDWISGGVIAALVLLNVVVGSYTEWQAEKVCVRTRPRLMLRRSHRLNLLVLPRLLWFDTSPARLRPKSLL